MVGADALNAETPQITNPGALWDESLNFYPRVGGTPHLGVRERRWPRAGVTRIDSYISWDSEVRALCHTQSVIYQAFSLFAENHQVLLKPRVAEIARHHNKTVPQVVFRFAVQLGMLPLTGTTDGAHMRHNLDIMDFTLTHDETQTMLALGGLRSG